MKERIKIIHQPSTVEIFSCLASMPQYSKILLAQDPRKDYKGFLVWLLERKYLKVDENKIIIKNVAKAYGEDASKVTKWVKGIYDDIFELNENRPDLFQTDGIKVTCHFKETDNYCSFDMCLPVLPRSCEGFSFHFVKSKLGVNRFWVKEVEYGTDGDLSKVYIWLEGGYYNRYREFAIDKAIFQEHIDFMDLYKKYSFEINKIINQLYKS